MISGFRHIRQGLADCFALLDTTDDAGVLTARYYTAPELLLCADVNAPEAVRQFFRLIEQSVSDGKEIVVALDYHNSFDPKHGAQYQAMVFDTVRELDAIEVEVVLREIYTPSVGRLSDGASVAGVLHDAPQLPFAEYQAQLDKVQAYIAAGDCYQINFTFPWQFSVHGHPARLYQRLMQRQAVPFGALIRWPHQWVLSRSPELFFAKKGQDISAKPMKGTAPASEDAQENQQRCAALASDGKNRAENLMIVDLLRNDLGKIAMTGSVQVPALFEVSRFGGVLQMTSTVTAKLPPKTSFETIAAALFPCGSITGAPKRRAMEIIDELETTPRGLYTGSIGWLSADVSSGDWSGGFSVVIRTLELAAKADALGIRAGKMGIGSGIVADSESASEYLECQQKAQFLTALAPEFSLIETMRAERQADGKYDVPLLSYHLDRLEKSAATLRFHIGDLSSRVIDTLRSRLRLREADKLRVRLTYSPSGEIGITSVEFAQSDFIAQTQNINIALHPEALQAGTIFRRHKTTVRTFYNRAIEQAVVQNLYDYVFFNQDGYLAEGARSNIYVKINNEWRTPPLADGALPGVKRQQLLARGEIANLPLREARISAQDWAAAEAVCVSNAFIGIVPATLVSI